MLYSRSQEFETDFKTQETFRVDESPKKLWGESKIIKNLRVNLGL